MSNILNNTFTGGMNLDSDITQVQSNQYRYAENVRVVTNDDGTTGALQNALGIKYLTILPDYLEILGSVVVDDLAIFITIYSEMNSIYLWDGIDFKLLLQEKLGITEVLSIVANKESENNIKVYFTGDDQIRIAHITENSAVLQDFIPNSNLKPLEIQYLAQGSLPAGKVAYCYQLFNKHGNVTVTSPMSKMYHLTSSKIIDGFSSLEYKGIRKGENSGKSVVMNVDILEGLFNMCRIIRVLYDTLADEPQIDIIDEFEIGSKDNKVTYVDYGNSFLSRLSVDEFNAYTKYQFSAKVLEKTQDRLFAANVKEKSWYPDYDARAYRANSDGVCKLYSSSSDKVLEFNLSELNENTVPKDHDCINLYNYSDSNNSDIDSFVYDSSGSVLGGSGINIDYLFVITDIQLSDKQEQDLLNADNHYMGVTQTDLVSNYANPLVDANLLGYMRDEIYCFGIVFYNKKSIATSVYWIGDIRMPRADVMPPFVYKDRTLYGQSLGVKFNIKNVPNDAVSYEIVRCNRTALDRTVVMQVVASHIDNYRLLETAEDQVGHPSDVLEDSNEYRPSPVIFNSNGFLYFGSNCYVNASDYDKLILRLISPEICITGAGAISLFDNTCYLDCIGVYYAPFISNAVLINAHYNYTDNKHYIHLSGASAANITKYYYPIYDNNFTDKLYISDIKYPYNYSYNDNVGSLIQAKKINVGDISYVNYAMTCFSRPYGETNIPEQDVMGPAGPCAIAKVNGITRKITIDSETLDKILTTKDYLTAAVIYNVKINNNNIYCGNTYSSRQNRAYISTTSFSTLADEIVVYGGDIYLSILDYPNTMVFLMNNGDEYGHQKTFVGSYIPFESTVNMNLFQGDLVHRTVLKLSTDSEKDWDSYPTLDSTDDLPTADNAVGDIFIINGVMWEWNGLNWSNLGSSLNPSSSTFIKTEVNAHLLLEPTQIQFDNVLVNPYFLYNTAYSALNTLKKFVPASMYSENNTHFGNRIMVSLAKTSNEITDSWCNFKVADYLDVDNEYGDITNLKIFKDKLFYFQDQAVGIASVNERSLITDGNANELVLGTGGILTRYDHVTTTNGSAVIADKSIITSDNCLYWYDIKTNEICTYTGQAHLLSKEKLVLSYLNKYPNQSNVVSLFDKKYNEVWFKYYDSCLIFNEQLNVFTSFYTYQPEHTLQYFDKVLVTFKNKIYQINNDKDRVKSKIQLVCNDNVSYTKVFDNINFQGIFKDAEGNLITNSIIDKLQFKTKHQTATIDTGENIMFDYREDTYRLPIPREDNFDEEKNMSYPARMKGKYMLCNCEFNKEYNFYIPYVFTTYRVSLV